MFPEGVGSSCGSEVLVKEFDVPLRPLCPARLWTRKGSSDFDLCGIWDTSISSAMRRACTWDVVELSQRVLNFDESGLWTRQCALG